ncbi:IS110 family transposase [Streptomyces sp. NPDC048191]|uniref:IS110 family transposase n=1 Tax=Streptomyces sp. NPDC048191 TaxID=3155484 RepID=UPI0033FEF3D7
MSHYALTWQEAGRSGVPPARQRQVELLATIPGMSTHTAEVILAEIGADISRFPSAGHLASWAGVCPGNYESAGKSPAGCTRPAIRDSRAC